MKTTRGIVGVLALLAASCSEPQLTTPTSATTPSSSTDATTTASGPRELEFSGQLDVGGSGFYSFRASQSGTATLMVASLTRTGTESASPAAVALGLGVPKGTDCETTVSVTTGATPDPLISETVQAGIYCARIADVGGLTGAVDFIVRIVAP